MAVETVAELYYQLGLDTTKLDAGFIDAQKTVNQNMRIMNRQEALIKLRADVQIQGLGENIELADAFKIRQEELAQRLDIVKGKVDLTSAAYEQMKQSQGENAEAAQLLAIQLEKERLVMAQLERQTRELNEQQKVAIGVQWELLGLIEPAVKGIQGLYTAGHTLGSLSALQAKVATAITMTLAAIVAGTKTATDELEEENLAKLLDNEFAQAQINISNSLDTINQQTLRTASNMNQAFQYQAQRPITNEDYISDFLRLITIATEDSDSLSDSLSKVTQNAQYMNTELGKTIALAIGVGKTFSELKESAKQWATPALEGFRDLQTKAQELKVTLPVASDIVNAISLANGDYEDVRDWVRGVQDAIIKGTADDPENLALEKYGVAIQDARGNLLPFNEALENMYQGFLKAKEAGEEEAYIIMTNGQSVHDVLPFLESYGKEKQKVNDIKWSTSDYDSLNELSQNMKLAEIQLNEFKTALSSLAIPFANYSAESDFNFFKTLTEIVDENRDTVLYWEFAFIEALKKVEDLAGSAVDSIIEKFNELKDSETLNSIVDFFDTITTPIQKIASIPFDLIGSFSDSDAGSGILEKAQKDLDDYNAANEKARAETEKTKKKIQDGLSYSLNRIRQFKDEIADIEIELKFGDNEYEKELAKLDQWRDKALRDAKYYSAEQDIIEQEYWLKRRQIVEKHLDEIERIEREKAERIAEIRRQVNSNFRTDLQNQFINIDVDKRSWIGDGLDESEAETLAQKLKGKAIEDLNREVSANLDSIWRNNLQNRLEGIEREKQAWIQKGVDEVKATQWAEQAKANAITELEQAFTERLNSINQSALEARLADIEKEKQAWIDKGIDEARATELAEQQKAQAIQDAENTIGDKQSQLNSAIKNRNKLYRDRQKIYREFAEHAQRVASQVQSIWDTELNNRLRQIDQERRAFIKQGVDEVDAARWATQAKVDAERNASMQILKTRVQAYHAFERGGYEALKRYELNQLYKQGITQKDLQMTPEQLHKFDFAQKAIQNSLMPNFMTDIDFRRQIAAQSGASNFKLPDVHVGMTTEWKDRLAENSEQIAKANEEINKLSNNISSARTALLVATKNISSAAPQNERLQEQPYAEPNNYNPPAAPQNDTPQQPSANPTGYNPQNDTSNINSVFEELQQKIESVGSYFEGLQQEIESASNYFAELAEQVSNVTGSFLDLIEKISNLKFPENNTPPNITNNVSIQEAHAWDYSHIQELAEMVANVITPRILSALGGNSNGY